MALGLGVSVTQVGSQWNILKSFLPLPKFKLLYIGLS